MTKSIYNNNDCDITSEAQDAYEAKINVNGENLICISLEDEEEFRRELSTLLDNYRI